MNDSQAVSTGEVAKSLGVSTSYVKQLAQLVHIETPRLGGRQRLWYPDTIKLVRELVEAKRRPR